MPHHKDSPARRQNHCPSAHRHKPWPGLRPNTAITAAGTIRFLNLFLSNSAPPCDRFPAIVFLAVISDCLPFGRLRLFAAFIFLALLASNIQKPLYGPLIIFHGRRQIQAGRRPGRLAVQPGRLRREDNFPGSASQDCTADPPPFYPPAPSASQPPPPHMPSVFGALPDTKAPFPSLPVLPAP